MKRLFKFKYPKLAILLVIIIFSYIIFSSSTIKLQINNLQENLGYIGILFSGILFSFGFTAPISVGFFLTINPDNILLASLIGGLGCAASDYLIFRTIKLSFMDEFNNLKKTRLFKKIHNESNHTIPKKVKFYLMYIFAGIIIASPLPDEFGVTMLAGLSHIKTNLFLIISLILNTLGIFILFLI